MVDLTGDNKHSSIVLSAGRTGTLYQTKLINSIYSNVTAMHEPALSRYLYVLGNVANYFRADRKALLQWYANSFLKRKNDYNRYIELNPLLCPLTDMLTQILPDLHIVHMVRNPNTWVYSLMQHGASAPVKPFMRMIPFNAPIPAGNFKSWFNMSKIERLLWRWSDFNRRINSLKDSSASYTIIQYEKLFNADSTINFKTVCEFMSALQLELPLTADALPVLGRVNKTAGKKLYSESVFSAIENKLLLEVVREQMEEYGYTSF